MAVEFLPWKKKCNSPTRAARWVARFFVKVYNESGKTLRASLGIKHAFLG
jgi:hypothetical protein